MMSEYLILELKKQNNKICSISFFFFNKNFNIANDNLII